MASDRIKEQEQKKKEFESKLKLARNKFEDARSFISEITSMPTGPAKDALQGQFKKLFQNNTEANDEAVAARIRSIASIGAKEMKDEQSLQAAQIEAVKFINHHATKMADPAQQGQASV